jgi:hypothetical protein
MKNSLLLIGALLLLASCEKIILPPSQPSDPITVFDELWRVMDEGYSFFDYKGVDWDSMYRAYRPQVYEGISDEDLYNVCRTMLNTLRDGHVNLRTGFARSYYNWYVEAPENFNQELLERNYWLGFEVTGPLRHLIIDSVGYIYYGSFATPFTDDQLDVVVNRFNQYPGIKGVIIDVRNNAGGNPDNGFRLLSRMIDEPTLLYYTEYKNGPAHDDFTGPHEGMLDPAEDHPHFTGKIAVLTNRKCYSACNFFAASITQVPNAVLIGDTTGGGGGQPTGYELPNGWAVNFSGSVTYLPDGFIIEEGLAPHQLVYMDPENEKQGVDDILDAALAYIRQ